MEFALQVRGAFPLVLRAAELAEREGLAAIALPDHYFQPTSRPASQVSTEGLDAFAQLAALGTMTDTIELAVLVAPVTFRHPAVMLKMATTIDEISGGRFRLGIGTGWLDGEHAAFGIPYPSLTVRYAMLEESLGYIRAALSGSGFHGTHFQLDAFVPQPPPQSLTLIVGGTGGRRTPALAGRLADEYNAYVQTPELMQDRIDRSRSAAAEAGRPAPFVSTASTIVTGRTEAEYQENLADFASIRSLNVTEVVAELEKQGIPHGVAQQVRDQIAALEDIGVRRYYIQLLGNATDDRIAATLDAVRG